MYENGQSITIMYVNTVNSKIYLHFWGLKIRCVFLDYCCNLLLKNIDLLLSNKLER